MFNIYPSLTADAPKYCPYCSTPPTYLVMHTGKCPCVRSIEYYPDGNVKEVHFWDECHSTTTVKYQGE